MSDVTLRNVSDAIQAILEDKVKDIEWKQAVMGPIFPKTLTGFICCDEVTFDPATKIEPLAKAVYGVQIVCPNPSKDTSTTLVEDYAMATMEALRGEPKLDGWAVDSNVESITFGTPAGNATIGIAIIKLSVMYELE